ncbi:ArsR/SmtB family transcription factor [Acidihalobacter prosperus]|uniref:Transcriptional regulator, ArsR family n=1 Tax=Acidihalobacter prosperus TaxID=160660 RepID=A0A1A6C1N6_9GAMM|nr:metalloregulator ArsR/SmtB family transcription factor [Acidihalobacter prosperus]OBS08481.1 Transcriptional regulator, ArsR family [Acidihalobacter prosperus]
MDHVIIFKALSNASRLQILELLKEPDRHFAGHEAMSRVHEYGVCVGAIQEKLGLSQSTVSSYLSLLQRAGLVEARRVGAWTYYRRNESTLHALGNFFQSQL